MNSESSIKSAHEISLDKSPGSPIIPKGFREKVIAPITGIIGKNYLDRRIRSRIRKLKEENPDLVVGELHCHSLHSDGHFPVDDILHRASSLGLDYVVVTEHLGASRFAMDPVIQSIKDRRECVRNWQLKETPPVTAYPAFESSTEQGHLLSLFPEAYLQGTDLTALDKRFRPLENKWHSAETAASWTRSMGGVNIVPHPDIPRSYPFGIPLSFIRDHLMGLVDGIEDISAGHGFNEDYSTGLGLSSIGSSDDHFNLLIGAAVTVYDGSRHGDLLAAIKAHDTRAISIDSSLNPVISTARKIF